jgi:hypothetical protein
MTESQRRKCIEPLTQIIKSKRRFKRVQAKHGIKHAPPSSNLNENAAIKDTRPVKRPELNFVLKGSNKSKTSANDTGPTLDEAQNELPGVKRKGIHPNESKTTSTSVQMEPQDLITQEDFDPDTGNTANKEFHCSGSSIQTTAAPVSFSFRIRFLGWSNRRVPLSVTCSDQRTT